jgi:signal-transduction protein with cAMP-binding, CBS, and nucleotidyltransferase domain
VNVTIDELMQHPVMAATPHQSVGHVRKVMSDHTVSAMPVVDSDGRPVGIVTATDMLEDHKDATPISKVMASPVYTVARYDGPHIAARVMRNHHLHHVVVTEAKEIVGMLSSFDLLRLVEDHRFVAKQGPTASKKRVGRR